MRLHLQALTVTSIRDLSFAALQYQKFGYLTNTMVVVNLLHALYVVDFFVNEDW